MARMSAVMALACCLAVGETTTAADAMRIAFDVPSAIQARVEHNIAFDNLQRVSKHEPSDFLIKAEINGVGSENGFGITVWIEQNMSRENAVHVQCKDEPLCRSASPPADLIWRKFRDAFNSLLFQNPKRLGQYRPTRCGRSADPAWTEFVIESLAGPRLERLWRYKVAGYSPTVPPQDENYYYYQVLFRDDARVQLLPDHDDDKDTALMASTYTHELCQPKELSTELEKLVFVAQLNTRDPQSRKTAEPKKPLENQ